MICGLCRKSGLASSSPCSTELVEWRDADIQRLRTQHNNTNRLQLIQIFSLRLFWFTTWS